MTLFDYSPIPGSTSIQSVWDRRAPIDVAHGSRWYDVARADIRRRLYTPLPTSCAIVAVLSPRVEWSRNIRLAESLVTGQTKRGACLARCWDTACEIFHRSNRGRKWEHLVSGPKVRAFWQALQGSDTWVIDSHMVGIFHGYTYRSTISISMHRTIERTYEDWYSTLRFHRATQLTRVQVQAVLWLTWKRRFLSHIKG